MAVSQKEPSPLSPMCPGDKIFIYTDGLPEATAQSGEMFGVERMIAALNTRMDGSPESMGTVLFDSQNSYGIR